MTDEPEATPKLPPNTVVLNGAAFNLLTRLTEGIREDMRAMESRLTQSFTARFDSHEEVHALEAAETSRVREDGFRRLRVLEEDDRADDAAVALSRARRDGQLSVFRTLVSVVDKYGKWIVLVLTVGFGLVAAAVGGVEITVGG